MVINNAETYIFTFYNLFLRPQWDDSTSPDELDRREKDNFLDWRRTLAR